MLYMHRILEYVYSTGAMSVSSSGVRVEVFGDIVGHRLKAVTAECVLYCVDDSHIDAFIAEVKTMDLAHYRDRPHVVWVQSSRSVSAIMPRLEPMAYRDFTVVRANKDIATFSASDLKKDISIWKKLAQHSRTLAAQLELREVIAAKSSQESEDVSLPWNIELANRELARADSDDVVGVYGTRVNPTRRAYVVKLMVSSSMGEVVMNAIKRARSTVSVASGIKVVQTGVADITIWIDDNLGELNQYLQVMKAEKVFTYVLVVLSGNKGAGDYFVYRDRLDALHGWEFGQLNDSEDSIYAMLMSAVLNAQQAKYTQEITSAVETIPNVTEKSVDDTIVGLMNQIKRLKQPDPVNV
jgi:hypothetical protein